MTLSLNYEEAFANVRISLFARPWVVTVPRTDSKSNNFTLSQDSVFVGAAHCVLTNVPKCLLSEHQGDFNNSNTQR